MYHAIGNTFHVIVMQSTNISGFVTMNFIPIGGNEPNITMDYIDTFDKAVTTHVFSMAGEFTVFEDVTINFSNTITKIDLALGLLSSDITGDNGTNSKNAAQKLYENDLARVPQPTAPTPPDQLQRDISWLVTNPFVILMVLVFGGILGFFQWGKGTIQWVRNHSSSERLKKPEKQKNRHRRTLSK